MSDVVLVLNVGSSSQKFALYRLGKNGAPERIFRGKIEGIFDRPRFEAKDAAGQSMTDDPLAGRADGPLDHETALALLLRWIERHDDGLRLVGAGHRVVHGGTLFHRPLRLDAKVREQLAGLVPLAPLHQPHNLAAIAALSKLMPDLPQVACFDTGFHHDQPAVAQAFALPRNLSAEGIKRYGFHGLSYEYIAQALPDHAGATAEGRVVVAHLGNGASMCAMRGRKSVATTMGFTAIEGLMMGTRSGSIDPGVVLYLLAERGMSVEQVTNLLYKQSGLLGVSGVSGDMRTLLASDRPETREAVDLFVYRAVRELGSLAAALGGLDALVFTAGIGEHAPEIRARISEGAAWLGLRLDATANQAGGPRISDERSRVLALVLPTDEERMIARHTIACLELSAPA